MYIYEGFDVYYIFSYSHNTHAADLNAALFTNECFALIVEVRLKWRGFEPLITSHEFPRVSSLHSYTKPYKRGMLSIGARASDLKPVMQEPFVSAAVFHRASC